MQTKCTPNRPTMTAPAAPWYAQALAAREERKAENREQADKRRAATIARARHALEMIGIDTADYAAEAFGFRAYDRHPSVVEVGIKCGDGVDTALEDTDGDKVIAFLFEDTEFEGDLYVGRQEHDEEDGSYPLVWRGPLRTPADLGAVLAGEVNGYPHTPHYARKSTHKPKAADYITHAQTALSLMGDSENAAANALIAIAMLLQEGGR